MVATTAPPTMAPIMNTRAFGQITFRQTFGCGEEKGAGAAFLNRLAILRRRPAGLAHANEFSAAFSWRKVTYRNQDNCKQQETDNHSASSRPLLHCT
jgi:hypothetical protein